MNFIRTVFPKRPDPTPPTFSIAAFVVETTGDSPAYVKLAVCDRCGCVVASTVTHKRKGCS